MKAELIIMRTLSLAFALVVCAAGASGGEIPLLTGRVNDYAGLLSTQTTGELERLLKAEEDSTSNQVVVLTVKSLDGEPIESYSIRVVESWKLGQRGKDNGVLLLVSQDDRKVRIEVGRGLEGTLPDITCGRIIRNQIIPHLKQADYNSGVSAGVEAIIAAIGGSYTAEDEHQESDNLPLILGGIIFIIVVGTFTFIGAATRGPLSWILYVFLIPFWFGLPAAIVGPVTGVAFGAAYLAGFLLLKTWIRKNSTGQSAGTRWGQMLGVWSSGSGGWGSPGSGSSGGGFSGGGGSFSGGGASGSW